LTSDELKDEFSVCQQRIAFGIDTFDVSREHGWSGFKKSLFYQAEVVFGFMGHLV